VAIRYASFLSFTDAGETWSCEYERTAYNGYDYWDLQSDDFHATAPDNCYGAARYCDNNFQPGGGGPYSNVRNTVRMDPWDDGVFPIPT
jgi:hypothetical protein